jgi:hypothetical protein
MKKPSSERHHWWPECVSQHWRDDKGGVTRILFDGKECRLTPKNMGVIGNGHFIKLGKAGEQTYWDQNFECSFDSADNAFPNVIVELEKLERIERFNQNIQDRFLPQDISDDLFRKIIESITSLAVRSPKTRFRCVALAEQFRANISERDRNNLIAINMKDMQSNAVKSFALRGKATAIFSPYKEFIFGDGFYHNLSPGFPVTMTPRILVPLTPRLSILYTIPMQHNPSIRMSTFVLDAKEAEELNKTVQIYSKTEIFFRSERPELISEFKDGAHYEYASAENIVVSIANAMPGVIAGYTHFDQILEMIRRKKQA